VDKFRKEIVCSPEIQGGAPVVRGTRTPVRSIATLFFKTYPNDLAAVLAALPHLTVEQIQIAIQYYEAHRADIDADLERHREALGGFLAAS
jgi:uncharacterized protein (DUF433 family)